jgi:predicted nucleic acid-binding protein
MQNRFENFKKINVLDTCSVWNILSSRLLYQTAVGNSFNFCCTFFVHYECLHKPRTNNCPEDEELCKRLKGEMRVGKITIHHLALDDLNEIDILQKRKQLGKGELSSIAFSKRIQQAFLTDDQGARKLANEVLGEEFVQTTPQLFGYLIYNGSLMDSDKENIINEHKSLRRPLEEYFSRSYLIALELRLKNATQLT